MRCGPSGFVRPLCTLLVVPEKGRRGETCGREKRAEVEHSGQGGASDTQVTWSTTCHASPPSAIKAMPCCVRA